MPHANADLKNWQNWMAPVFFATTQQKESRLIPLLLRQIVPKSMLRTRLTVTGWCLIIVSLGLGTAAYTTGSNILFLALSLLLSSLILSGVLSWLNFRKLQWNLIPPKHLRAGDVGAAEVELANKKSFLTSMSICFQMESEMIPSRETLYMQQKLEAGKSCKLEWTFVPNRRGRFNLLLSGVQSKFPFGFLKKIAGSDLQSTVFVWPARVEYTFKASSGGPYNSVGGHRNQAGHGNDLLNIKRYEQGDPPRLIHWKATARMRRLMVRKLSSEKEDRYHIRVDTDASQWNAELFELLCSLVCSLASDLFSLGKLESTVIGDSNPVKIRTIHDVYTFFDQLSLVEREDTSKKIVSIARSRNQITFRPHGSNSIAIYVKENFAGKVNN